jgi:hypothetical protein
MLRGPEGSNSRKFGKFLAVRFLCTSATISEWKLSHHVIEHCLEGKCDDARICDNCQPTSIFESINTKLCFYMT